MLERIPLRVLVAVAVITAFEHGLLVARSIGCSPFLFPSPATVERACRFPALRSPVRTLEERIYMSDNQTIGSTNNSLMVDRWLAYGIFRFTLGINRLIHGVGRLFGLGTGEFAAKTSSAFAGTPLPQGVVYAFLVVLPFAEAILGGLVIVGLLTRWTLALGGLLIAALVFGTALRSDWSTVGIQMVYAITYYFLLRNLADDYFSVDTLLARYRKRLAL